MHRIDEIQCTSQEVEQETQEEQEDEDFHWGEGCCEDVLMDDDFYEREYCD